MNKMSLFTLFVVSLFITSAFSDNHFEATVQGVGQGIFSPTADIVNDIVNVYIYAEMTIVAPANTTMAASYCFSNYSTTSEMPCLNTIPSISTINNLTTDATLSLGQTISPCQLFNVAIINNTFYTTQYDANTPLDIGTLDLDIASFSPEIFASENDTSAVSTLSTPPCCEAYFHIQLTDTSDVSLQLSLPSNSLASALPFTSICVRNGTCPVNPPNDCFFQSAISNATFAFSQTWAAGDYWVRFEVVLGGGNYNINITRSMHTPTSSGNSTFSLYNIVALLASSFALMLLL